MTIEIDDLRVQVTHHMQSLRPHGTDARDEVPDIGREALQFLKDQISGAPPTTLLGVLVDRRRAMELVTIAGLIGQSVPEVEWTVEVLEAEGFCRSFDDDGIAMVEFRDEWSEKPKSSDY